MQDHVKRLTYLPADLSESDFEVHAPLRHQRVQIEPGHPMYGQCEEPFSQAMYRYPSLPLFVGKFEVPDEKIAEMDLNVLRLLVRLDDRHASLFIPRALAPVVPLVLQNVNYHRQHFPANADCFVYLTVRVSDHETMFYRDATMWHADGFQGARVPRHRVEQNCFYSNVNPTEFSLQPYFCEGLNPRLHDANEFFDRTTNPAYAIKGVDNGIYFINPYHVHRASPEPFTGRRLFVRLNFSPVLIEDPTSTPNPCHPLAAFEERDDVRNYLHAYGIDERPAYGFA